jgi:hypothetical protein
MRIALMADYYPAYLRAFHSAHDLTGAGFAEHQRTLLDDYFGAFVSYRSWFNAIGHTCELFLPNAFELQQKWLDERGIAVRADPTTKKDVLLRQLEEFQPDVLFAGSQFEYFGDFFRRALAHVRRVVVWVACPHPSDLDLSHVSCVVSSVPAFVDGFRARGVRSEGLAAAFDEQVARRLAAERDDLDVTFVGGMHRRSHRFRVDCIRGLLGSGLPVEVWGYGLALHERLFQTKLARAMHGEAWGMEMYRILARSKIALNFHIDVARQASFVGNMRMYEATGCGALLLTDTAPGVEALFQPGVEIETYRSPGELAEKIRWYLARPAEREAIARRGQEACLARHGYAKRIREFERILLDVA